MGGGKPDMSFKLCPDVERWNFFRENTHRTFTVNRKTGLQGFIWLIVVPALIYKGTVVEQTAIDKQNGFKPKDYWLQENQGAERRNRFF